MLTQAEKSQHISREDSSMLTFNSNLESLTEETMAPTAEMDFHPDKHIDFKPPTKTYSMSDILLKKSPLSDFAVSEPFQLFTPKAIACMREEIFKPQVMNNFQYSSNLAQCQLRGYAAK